jgi:SHS2 domain-containing protein
VRIEASTPAGLFEEAAVAMTEAITTAAAVEPRASSDVSLDWLVARATVEIVTAGVYRLGARIEGEARDASRHPIKVLLKAVTYHGLEVKQHGDVWVAQIIFDI